MKATARGRLLAAGGLYAITPDTQSTDVLCLNVAAVLATGAPVLQYRRKATPPAAQPAEARRLRGLCTAAGALFIVNDDPALAQRVGADGVHLGRDDPELAAARARLGPEAVLGISCYDSLERAEAAVAAGADYVAFGRFFPSRSKPHARPAPRALLRRAQDRLPCPIVAIGGITPDNGEALLTAGARMLAVIEGLFGAADPAAEALRFQRLFSPPSKAQHEDPWP